MLAGPFLDMVPNLSPIALINFGSGDVNDWGAALRLIYTWLLVISLFNLAIEVCILKAVRWGSWWVCLGDTLLLNFLAGITIWFLYGVLHLYLSIPDMTVITILVKGSVASLLSDQSPRKSWIMPVVTTAALYIFYTILTYLYIYLRLHFHWR
jgi:hypothetical protein